MNKSIHSTTELARHLGLSRWSVSRAINGQSGVSAGTTAQVRAAMEEFGFTPSPHGRGLRGHRTGAIGICFRELSTTVTTQKIAAIQRRLSARGYRPLLEFAELDQRMGTDVIRHFISMRVEAVLLVDMPVEPEAGEWMKMLKKYGIPSVAVEPLDEVPASAVHVDREEAMARLTTHLLGMGHEQFALLGISRQFPLGRPRHAGVIRALRAASRNVADVLEIIDVPEHRYGGLDYGRELAELLLARPRRATALLALNDEVAAGALWRLQRAGWRCPEEFSISGFDNLPIAEQTSPQLSSVDHNVAAVADAAVEMLLQRIEGGLRHAPATAKIEPRLILRGSVGAPPPAEARSGRAARPART